MLILNYSFDAPAMLHIYKDSIPFQGIIQMAVPTVTRKSNHSYSVMAI